MLTFFAALCQKCANSPSLKLFFSAIIDDEKTISTDLWRANVGDMKNMNNHINPLNIQWACSLSLQLYARNVWISPLWSCLLLWLLMMRRQSTLICKEQIMQIWKKITIASIFWIYSQHAHLLCSFLSEISEFFLFEVNFLCNYLWCGDSRCWFAKI